MKLWLKWWGAITPNKQKSKKQLVPMQELDTSEHCQNEAFPLRYYINGDILVTLTCDKCFNLLDMFKWAKGCHMKTCTSKFSLHIKLSSAWKHVENILCYNHWLEDTGRHSFNFSTMHKLIYSSRKWERLSLISSMKALIKVTSSIL